VFRNYSTSARSGMATRTCRRTRPGLEQLDARISLSGVVPRYYVPDLFASQNVRGGPVGLGTGQLRVVVGRLPRPHIIIEEKAPEAQSGHGGPGAGEPPFPGGR
jgi:hypothetical protein